MINQNYFSRQSGLVTPQQLSVPILIIGAGSIGSWTALALCKMGCTNVTVMDHDAVEEQNIGSQIYTSSDVGARKVTALADKIVFSTETEIKFRPEDWTTPVVNMDAEIIISAVDTMSTRKDIFNALRDGEDTGLHFIDGRMGGNEINLYCLSMDDKEAVARYDKELFTDDIADPTPCSERSIMYNTFVCGGLIASHVARIVNKEPLKFETIVDLMNFTME